MIERIGLHYKTNIANRFLRPALLHASMEKEKWNLLELLTEKAEQYQSHGFDLEEIYRQIAAAAEFVSVIRQDVAPVLRNRLPSAPAGQDKVFREMAVHNFGSNLQIFADLLSDLYVSLVEMDKANAKGRRPIYTTIPELEDVGRLLIGS